MEDINPDILKAAAGILRKRALELYSLEDEPEIFELVGGIETRINFFTLLNGQVDAWTLLFKSIDNNFVHSIIPNYYKLILMELVFISKYITSKYLFIIMKSNIILMILIFTIKCCIYSEYK